jgi:hypothetical protein
MKWKIAFLLAWAATPLFGGIYFQFGLEAFGGGRYHLFSLAPWGGVRVPLGNTSSLLFKFRQQGIAFDYETDEGVEQRQRSKLSMFTGVYYYQKGKIDAYAAAFQMFGSGRYSASGADAGLAYRLFPGIGIETGVYLLTEKSILWYPDEPERRISLFIWRCGMGLKLGRRLEFKPEIYLGRNSEDVSTFSYSASLTYSPLDPVFITLTYSRYSETAEYRFGGNYLSGGINFYF